MKRNTRGRLTTIIVLAMVLGIGLASNGRAQIIGPKQPTIPLNPILPSPDTLVEITAGAFHTCVRKYDGRVYCWGLNGWDKTNTSSGGQIGVGSNSTLISTTTCKDAPVQNPMHPTIGPSVFRPYVDHPAYVTQLTMFSGQIVAGDYHTCALSAGTASCWGLNFSGQLGDGGQTDRGVPWNVSTSAVFTRLAAGESSTCGLSQSGIFCWGIMPYNWGVAPYQNPPPPSPAYEVTPFALYASSGVYNNITVGNKFTCFVAGQGWNENDCQGIDSNGQLGIVSTPGTSTAPSWVPRDASGVPYMYVMYRSQLGVGASGAAQVASVSAGPDYICGNIMDGTVQCLGSNAYGKLGTSGGDRANGMVVVAGATSQLHGVTTGSTHACALDPAGSAWCWGLGQYGELGTAPGWNTMANFAQQVAGNIKFIALAAGDQHTCGIGSDNHVYCWGDNEYGQLGITYNGLGNSNLLVPVTATGTPQQIASF